jgi:CheY-like chemotaxis protein
MAAKVLIVDDEDDVLESTKMLVSMLGYEAIAVQDPGEVLEVAQREKPGVILQDLRMKGLNLAGFVASLRSNPATAEIPLVFFSASGELAHTASKYDAWGYLSKPFTGKELEQVLAKVLGGPAGTVPEAAAARKRDVNAIFHDYWNLLSALASYTQVLSKRPDLGEEERKILASLDEVIVKLESKTDHLRNYMIGIAESDAEKADRGA